MQPSKTRFLEGFSAKQAKDLLDQLNFVIFIVDDSRRIMATTWDSAEIPTVSPALRNDRGMLKARRESEDQDLAAAVTGAARQGQNALVTLRTREGLPTIAVTVRPWGADVLVRVVTLSGPRVPTVEATRKVLGLTAAEARLALRLAAGDRLQEAAVACGLTIGSARVTLRRVFRKCGVGSQGDLVAVLARLWELAPSSGT